jgi:hypothetical protein
VEGFRLAEIAGRAVAGLGLDAGSCGEVAAAGATFAVAEVAGYAWVWATSACGAWRVSVRREGGSGLGLDALGESGGDGQRERGSRGEYGAHEECCEDADEREHGALSLLEVM